MPWKPVISVQIVFEIVQLAADAAFGLLTLIDL